MFTPQVTRHRGFMLVNTRSIERQGDAGWGVSKGPTHYCHHLVWHDVEDANGNVVGRASKLVSQSIPFAKK